MNETTQHATPPLDDFTHGYVECALWLADEDSGPEEWTPHDQYTVDNIDQETLATMVRECQAFQAAHAETLDEADWFINVGHPLYNRRLAGQDFYLTRNRHGAGYGDRGLKDVGDTLTDAAHRWGEYPLYLGDDGRLYGR
jgi:hypothetical protein